MSMKRVVELTGIMTVLYYLAFSKKAEEDRLRSYDLGVNAYVAKPVGLDNFCEPVRTMNLFWQWVDLPE